ncbi:MAG: ABC transporter ATP-binding protein [Nitrospirae bacterium]|nr:ABC transporter ATP-binding protein [Nitrospirota bacterium]
MEEIVRISCVKHVYPDSTEVHLCGLDFVVRKGERVVIIGPNGSGKSTLLYHILGLLSSNEGSVRVFGQDPAHDYDRIREKIGVVLQNVEEQIIAPTVEEDVSFSPRNYGYPEHGVKDLVDDVLRELGISHIRHKICHYLSGGEKRKVALAGALVLKPELLILDEPFEGLDPMSRRELVSLLNRLCEKWGMSVIMSTHDINVISQMADYVYVLGQGGEILVMDTPADLFTRTEYYRQARLDFPILIELFRLLKEKGLAIDMPLDVKDAAEQIERLAGMVGHPHP